MNRMLAPLMILPLLAAAAPPPPAARDEPERISADRDKLVCKRFVRTGSLVDGYRTCKTKWEWERERENLRSFGVSDSCSTRAEPDPLKAGGGCLQ